MELLKGKSKYFSINFKICLKNKNIQKNKYMYVYICVCIYIYIRKWGGSEEIPGEAALEYKMKQGKV